MNKKLLLTLLLVLVSAAMVFPQELMVTTMGVSPAAIKADTLGNPHYLGIKDRVSTGITNAGVGTKVYLRAAYADSFLTNVSWSMTATPDGSEAELTVSDMADSIATFVPDVEGSYTIEIMDGATTANVEVFAGTFVGDIDNNCSFCHGPVIDTFGQTGHATFLDEALDGVKSSHYNEGCVSCHTVGWDTLATNDGFDDFEFMFPSVLEEGMADSMYATYPEAMKRANIQCENCHGPASGHNDGAMSVSLEPDACAACHDDDHYHVYPSQWEVSNHASLNRPYTRASCAPCHNGQGFVDWVDGGKVDIEEDLAENHNITCAVCHDPHEVTNEYQLRTIEATLPNGDVITDGGKSKLCMNCHNSRRIVEERIVSDLARGRAPEPHHGPQAEVLTTMNVETFGLDLPTSPHLQAADDGCVNCHMYEQGSHGEHDPDGMLNTSGMHSFAMVNQQGVDNVNSCSPCHASFGADFGDKVYYLNGNADHDGDGNVEGLQHEVEGLLEILHAALPQDEEGELEADSTTSYDIGAAMYNYFLVEEDRSMGIHNPAFTITLLQASIDAATGVNSIDTRGFLPLEYELSQNYPNPFNPTTQIDFSIKTAGNVELKIYDMLGREITTLVDENMAPGKHSVNFDASNLASGVYVYRIVAGNEFTAIKKMVLIR